MTTVRLTADLCAQAIVASCRVYGADPLKVMAASRGGRLPLVPAALAILKVTGVTRLTLKRVLGVANTSLVRHETAPPPLSQEAQTAAWVAMDAPEDTSETASAAPAPARPEAAPTPSRAVVVDHTPAIKAALARRRERSIDVVGAIVPKPANGEGLCHWPTGAPLGAQDDPTCDADVVPGRLFCAAHCRALGQKDTPVALAPAVMPAGYRDPRADNAIGRRNPV